MATHQHLTRGFTPDTVTPADVELLRNARGALRPESDLRDVLDGLLLSLCSAAETNATVVVDISRTCQHSTDRKDPRS